VGNGVGHTECVFLASGRVAGTVRSSTFQRAYNKVMLERRERRRRRQEGVGGAYRYIGTVAFQPCLLLFHPLIDSSAAGTRLNNNKDESTS